MVVNLHDLGFGTKSKSNKKQINWTSEIKISQAAKAIIKKIKRQPTELHKNIFKPYI